MDNAAYNSNDNNNEYDNEFYNLINHTADIPAVRYMDGSSEQNKYTNTSVFIVKDEELFLLLQKWNLQSYYENLHSNLK